MTKHKPSDPKPDVPRAPFWVILTVVVSVLPVLGWPFYMLRYGWEGDPTLKVLGALFPVYILTSGYLAYRCYPIRREITYVLLVIMWLSYGATLLI